MKNILISCCLLGGLLLATTVQAQLIDKKATKKTKALYENLRKLSQQAFMFGHQDDEAYGVHWKSEKGRSDIKDICQSYPAVHGWDVGKIGRPFNIDTVNFDRMIGYIKEVYRRGGINTISWHIDNPVSGGDSWDRTKAVGEILKGGEAQQRYVKKLDLFAEFLNRCKVGLGTKIPIIFRPFHEQNGAWFWWGKGHRTNEEYIALWKFTVDYLMHEKNIHHLIYAYSPDRSRLSLSKFDAEYLEMYPGDDYVDIFGIDNYHDMGRSNNPLPLADQQQNYVISMKQLINLAQQHQKLAALTETGLNQVTNPQWFTKHILNPLKQANIKGLTYVLVWRNARTDHHYAPYQGHPSAADFLRFKQDHMTLFEDDLPNMYRKTID